MGRDTRRSCWYVGAAACALVAPAAVASVPAASYAGGSDRPAVVEQRVIGHSMQGRPMRVWRLGDPDARQTVVAMATLHGDEPVPRRTLGRLRDGAPIRGVDLWVLPIANPDGLARGSRYNANGVDLNRNFPVRWQRQAHHGRGPASARETRVLMRFLRNVRPDRIVSFHQPLRGVDTHGSKRPRFARRLADNLRLPRKRFDCGGGCHGTMTQWYNRRFPGVAITVEYGPRPRDRYVNRVAARGLLRSVGGRR
jgi:murein peptide amidase A